MKSIYDDEDDTTGEELTKSVIKPPKKKTTKAKSKPKKSPKEVMVNSVAHTKVVAPTPVVIIPEKFPPDYIKHLVSCRCVLAQFESMKHPPDHKFVVFSELDEDGMIIPSHAQCNNCGIIHRVTEVETSYTLKRETLMSLQNIDDIKTSSPDWLIGILEQYQCELHVWQEAKFILDNNLWGRFIVLSKEKEQTLVFGKLLQILGKNLYKINNFERDDEDVRP